MELMRVSEDIKDGMEVQAVIFITKGTVSYFFSLHFPIMDCTVGRIKDENSAL